MKIENIMSKNVVTVEMDDNLSVIKEIFDNTAFHHVLVLNKGKLFGVISDRDMLKAISPFVGTASETPRDTASLNKRAHQIMSRKPVSLPITAMVQDAIIVFNQISISCIPIINESNVPVGIVSWRDILRIIDESIGTVSFDFMLDARG